MHDMPQRLREDISMEECGDLLTKIGFFKKAEDKFIQEVALTTSVYLFAPGDIILYRGDMGREMYCIQKGYVEVCSRQRNSGEVVETGHVHHNVLLTHFAETISSTGHGREISRANAGLLSDPH